MARTYSSALPMASSSEPESIVCHADEGPGWEEGEGDVGVVGIDRWAEWAERCDALEGAREVVERAETAEEDEVEERVRIRPRESLLRVEAGVGR